MIRHLFAVDIERFASTRPTDDTLSRIWEIAWEIVTRVPDEPCPISLAETVVTAWRAGLSNDRIMEIVRQPPTPDEIKFALTKLRKLAVVEWDLVIAEMEARKTAFAAASKGPGNPPAWIPPYVIQVLFIVLMWLIIFAAPAVVQASWLPPDTQTTADAYDGIIAGLAVVLTVTILSKHKHK